MSGRIVPRRPSLVALRWPAAQPSPRTAARRSPPCALIPPFPPRGTGKTCPLCRASIKTGLTPVHKARPGEENRRPAPPARPFPPEALASRGNGYQNRAGRVAAFAVLDHARAREVAAAAADSIRAPAAGSGSNSEPTEHAPSVVSAAQRTRNAMRRALSVQSLRFRSAGASRG